MKYTDIQNVASDIAVSYIEKGYHILPTNASWSGHLAVIFLRKGLDHIAVAIDRKYYLGNKITVDTYAFQTKSNNDIMFGWDDDENRIDHRNFFAIDKDWFTEDANEYDAARRTTESRNLTIFKPAHSFKPSDAYIAKMRKVYGFKTAKHINIIRSNEGYTVVNDKNDRTYTVSFRDSVNYMYRIEQSRRRAVLAAGRR